MEMKIDLDTSGKKVVNGTDEIFEFKNGNMKIFKGLNLIGNGVIGGSDVLFLFRDNKIRLFQVLNLGEKKWSMELMIYFM